MPNRRGGGKRPDFSVVLSAKVGGGYKKGPSFGMWRNDGDGPFARGVVKESYAEEVAKFVRKYGEDGVSFALFKNDSKKFRREEEEEGRKEEEGEEEEEEPRRRPKRGGKGGKKDSWDFD